MPFPRCRRARPIRPAARYRRPYGSSPAPRRLGGLRGSSRRRTRTVFRTATSPPESSPLSPREPQRPSHCRLPCKRGRTLEAGIRALRARPAADRRNPPPRDGRAGPVSPPCAGIQKRPRPASRGEGSPSVPACCSDRRKSIRPCCSSFSGGSPRVLIIAARRGARNIQS